MRYNGRAQGATRMAPWVLVVVSLIPNIRQVATWRDLGSCTASANPIWNSQRMPQHVEGAFDVQVWGTKPFPHRAASVRAEFEASIHDRQESGGKEVAHVFEENQKGDIGDS